VQYRDPLGDVPTARNWYGDDTDGEGDSDAWQLTGR
jgi:hypothetical protein